MAADLCIDIYETKLFLTEDQVYDYLGRINTCVDNKELSFEARHKLISALINSSGSSRQKIYLKHLLNRNQLTDLSEKLESLVTIRSMSSALQYGPSTSVPKSNPINIPSQHHAKSISPENSSDLVPKLPRKFSKDGYDQMLNSRHVISDESEQEYDSDSELAKDLISALKKIIKHYVKKA